MDNSYIYIDLREKYLATRLYLSQVYNLIHLQNVHHGVIPRITDNNQLQNAGNETLRSYQIE